MQATDLKWLKTIKPGDIVMATFQCIDDKVESAEGEVTAINDETIIIDRGKTGRPNKCQYGMWQMLSLVCIEKDFSYIRPGDANTDLDRLAALLG